MDVATLRRLAAAALLTLGALAVPPAAADQTDPRLGALFAQLQAASDAAAAEPVEAEIWQRWLRSGDAQTDTLMQAGLAALAAADNDAALAAFSRVVQRSPDFAEGWNKRATTLYAMGRYAESIADIGRVLALEPRHFGALSGLGLCNAQLDRLRAAVDAFERALAVDPTMPGVRANLRNLKQMIAKQSI